jgi:hypothetical protein
VAETTGQQVLVRQEGDANALQLYHSLTDAFKHAPHLVVTPFDKGDFKPGFFILAKGADLARLRPTAINGDACLELGDAVRVRAALQLHLVSARDGRRARHQEIRQIAIVGQDHQAGGVKVQPSHRIDALLDALHQGNNGRTALRIFDRGNISNGLVDQQIEVFGGLSQQATVHANVILLQVGFRPELGHGLSVNGDAAFQNDLFGLSARGNPRVSDDFLKALFHK